MTSNFVPTLRTFLLFIGFFVLMGSVPLQSQSLGGVDLTTVNVDDLTDAQILDYIRQAEERGLTEPQLEQIARQRGVSELQISKLRRRVATLRTGGSARGGVDNLNPLLSSSLLRSDQDFASSLQGSFGNATPIFLTEKQKKIFGYGLFQNQNLSFAPNLNIPTPKDYVLGAGDELTVDLWGATQQYLTLKVSPEGVVRPEGLSPVYVNGLTVKQAESKIVDRLSQIFGGLKTTEDEDQKIFYQISLGNVRSINVTVVGEVVAPGNYILNSLSTVFTALYTAGGPKEDGTFRGIRLMRNNKLEANIDLYDFLVDGIRPDDKVLKDGDVVLVKLFDKRVEVRGEVKRPGIFEIKAGESFKKLLSHAGGYNNNAFKSFINVDRNGSEGRLVLNISNDDLDNFEPIDGDIITVRSLEERYENRVQIEGAVLLEGDYELTKGLTVKELISKADGLRGDAYLLRANLTRVNSNFSQKTESFNLQDLLSGAIEDIELKNEDILTVYSVYDLQEELYVEIFGEVIIPGVTPYIHTMKVEDLILLSGGLTEGATGAKVEIARRVSQGSADSVSEIITLDINKDLTPTKESLQTYLQPFDQVFIRRTPNYSFQQTITIEGEVANPGVYAIGRKDERISDVIKRAGGITPYAYPEGAILIRKTEFEETKSEFDLNQEKLIQLSERIFSLDTTLIQSQARSMLLNRLNKLIKETDKIETEEIEEGVGNKFKKELAEGISETDPLVTELVINEEEPTVLELKDILDSPYSKYDYSIRDGDVISIPAKLETVRVAGEVISPLNLGYDHNSSFRDYINNAGGFTARARKGRSYVQYPNGRRKQARRFLFFKLYPKVEPGSTIFVSRKPDRQPVNFQAIVGGLSSLATLVLLLDRINN